ncbi:MAG: 50S ribosomal protein L10 [Thermomicrobiales bacterium]|nr:MAG: 50S ribosomal protein L10 [Thermomicrobiales bacterium]
MPTSAKAQTIDELSEQLANAKLVVLTDYRGLRVADLQDLRTNLRKSGGEIRVAKNTLTRIAAENAGITGLEPYLEGPLALGLANDDIVAFTKTLSDFARTSRILTIRGGVLDKNVISAEQVEAISTLPSKEVLQGKLLGLLQSPMARTVGVLSGPSRSIAYLLQARADQLGGTAMAAD